MLIFIDKLLYMVLCVCVCVCGVSRKKVRKRKFVCGWSGSLKLVFLETRAPYLNIWDAIPVHPHGFDERNNENNRQFSIENHSRKSCFELSQAGGRAVVCVNRSGSRCQNVALNVRAHLVEHREKEKTKCEKHSLWDSLSLSVATKLSGLDVCVCAVAF